MLRRAGPRLAAAPHLKGGVVGGLLQGQLVDFPLVSLSPTPWHEHFHSCRSAAKTDCAAAITNAVLEGYVEPTLRHWTGMRDQPKSAAEVGYCSLEAESSVKVVDGKCSGTAVALVATNAGAASAPLPPATTIAVLQTGEGCAVHAVDTSKHAHIVHHCATSKPSPWFMELDLRDCPATRLQIKPASVVATEKPELRIVDGLLSAARVRTSAIVSGAMESVLTECVRHAVTTSRYDQLQYLSPVVQNRLVRMAGLVYATDALVDFSATLLGTRDSSTSDSTLLGEYVPEADFTRLFAAEAALECLNLSEAIVGWRAFAGPVGCEARTAASPNYERISSFRKCMPFFLHSDATLADLRINALMKAEASVPSNAKGTGRLINLNPTLKTLGTVIEKDFGALVEVLAKKCPLDAKKEYMLTPIASIAAELLASLSVAYRCGASVEQASSPLSVNPRMEKDTVASAFFGNELLVATTFCEASAHKRNALFAELKRPTKTRKELAGHLWKTTDVEYATSPIMLAGSSAKPKAQAQS